MSGQESNNRFGCIHRILEFEPWQVLAVPLEMQFHGAAATLETGELREHQAPCHYQILKRPQFL